MVLRPPQYPKLAKADTTEPIYGPCSGGEEDAGSKENDEHWLNAWQCEMDPSVYLPEETVSWFLNLYSKMFKVSSLRQVFLHFQGDPEDKGKKFAWLHSQVLHKELIKDPGTATVLASVRLEDGLLNISSAVLLSLTPLAFYFTRPHQQAALAHTLTLKFSWLIEAIVDLMCVSLSRNFLSDYIFAYN